MATFRVLEGITDPAPPTTSVNEAAPLTLGVEMTVSEACTLTQVHFWQPSSGTISTDARTAAVYTNTNGTSGDLMGTPETITPAGSGWQTVTLADPKPLVTGIRYVVAVFHPAGQYVASSNFFTTARTSGPATFVSQADSLAGNGKFNSGAPLGFPGATSNASNYWVDVTVETSASSSTGFVAHNGTAWVPGSGWAHNGTAWVPASPAAL